MYPAYQMSDCSDDNHIIVAAHKPFMAERQDYWMPEYRELIGVLSYWNNGYRC